MNDKQCSSKKKDCEEEKSEQSTVSSAKSDNRDLIISRVVPIERTGFYGM